MKHLFIALLFINSRIAVAEEPAKIDVVETVTEHISHSLSETEAKALNEIVVSIRGKDHTAAFAKLKPILASCEQRNPDSPKKSLYFDSQEEFQKYVLGRDKKTDIEWVSEFCPRAYSHAGFLYVAAADKDNAFKYLKLAAQSAPYWAGPHNEMGYLFGRLKDYKSAIASYEKAIELADAHKNSANVKPLSLRGLGFILTEMGELERAKKAYLDSLVLDPGNKLAENELEYIRQLEARK